MGNIAVIDTETTWDNRVMSIGTVIADGQSFRPIDAKYHILIKRRYVQRCAVFGGAAAPHGLLPAGGHG